MPPELWTLRQVISTFNAAFIKSKGKWVAIVAKIKVALLVKDTPNLFFWIIICIFVLPQGVQAVVTHSLQAAMHSLGGIQVCNHNLFQHVRRDDLLIKISLKKNTYLTTFSPSCT